MLTCSDEAAKVLCEHYACLRVHASIKSRLAGIQLHQLPQRFNLHQLLCECLCKYGEDVNRLLQFLST